MKLAIMIPLIAMALIPMAFALESDESYLLDDTEFISIIIDVDSNGKTLFSEVIITPEAGQEYSMNAETAKIVRISDDGMQGKIFGKSTDGDSVLLLYKISGDEVKLLAKIWTDSGVERIVSNGEVISLF